MRRGIATIQNALVAIPCLQRLLLLLLVLLSAPGLRAQDVLTYHNDNARSGLNPAESILTPANVNSTQFGLLFTVSVDGLVDAQPLYASGVVLPNQAVHDVLIVATEHDSVFAFDAVDGALLWQASAVSAGETTSDNRGCSFITPEIGITSTPVIDRSSGPHGTVYVVAMSKDASGNYHQRLHALDLTTGSEEFGGPMEIQAQYPGTGANSSNGYVIFDPAQYMERPGLLLLNGVIYTAWSSHCDFPPYTGWLIGYDEHTLAQTTVLNITPNGSEGAIWQSGGGLAADSDGYIYFLDANGTFDTTLNAQGFPSQGDYANAFMKLSTAGGGLSVADYFTMWNTVYESDIDQDLGSGGAMVLPDMIDAQGNTRQLAVGAGKDGNIYLVDRNNMGKFNPNSDNIYQELDGAFSSGEWGSPAYFNGTLYYGGIFNYLRAFQFSSARLSSPTSWSAVVFTYPGATPSVSANGTQNGIVWATENTSPAVLHAYDPTNLANELYNTNQAPNQRDQFGNGNKFIAPMISHGRVYVGTTTGVGVFGLLPAGTYVAPTGLGFGSQVVGSTSTAQAVSVSNFSGSALDVTSITASGSFAQTNSCPSILVAGDRCAIYATFSPTAIGPLTGTLTITDNSNGVTGSTQTVNLSGTGTPAPLVITASSGSMTYGGTAPIITPGYSGFVNGDTAASLTTPPTCSTTATAHSPAGSYPSTCSGAVDGNYSISYVNGILTVTAVTLTITANDATRAYGAANPTFTATYSGFADGDTASSLTGTLTCTSTATAGSPAGMYPITCSGQSSTNYNISYSAGTLTVTALPLMITANNATRAYGAANPTFTATYNGFVNGDTASSLTGTLTCSSTATAGSPAGMYPITCSGQSSTNYNISYSAGTLTVTAAPLTVTADNATRAYGAANPTFAATYGGFANGDKASSLTGTLTCSSTATAGSPAGMYPITCSGQSSTDYNISYSAGTLTVTAVPLTITASSGSMTYGGTAPVITPSYSGFVNGDTAASLTTPPTCSTTATAHSPVGSYPSSCSGAVDSNYTISYVNGTVTDSAAALAITASSASMTYGGTAPTPTPGYSGFVNGDTPASLTTPPTCTTTATSHSPAGSYLTSCSGAVDSNYTIGYVSGTVTDSAAALAITASSGSMTYGGTAPSITPSYSGFVNGDTSASLTTQPTCSTTATSRSAAGSYPSSCTGAVDSNYTISYVNGTVTDGAAALAITASSASMTYGVTAPTITPSYSGFVNGETAASLATPPTCSSTATAHSPAGSYPSICSGAVDSNYSFTYVAGNVTVNQVTPVITWPTPTPITYGTTLSSTQLNATASVPGTFVYSPATGATPGAGTDTLSVTFTPTDTTDNTLATQTVSLTVNKATPVITWATPAAISYGTTLSSTQLNATASVPGTFVYSPAAGTTPAGGTDTLSVAFTPTDAADNTPATQTVSLTVNKATPVITWATLTPITYGTTLSSTQLNATASVPGTFVYSPAAGTTPAGGTDTLSVAFTPTDTADYNTATATVTLAVADFIFTLPSGSSTASAGSSRSANVAPGQLATYTLSVGGEGGLSGAVAFTCTGAPSEATCTVSPNPLTVGNSATNITITVTTTAPSVSAPRSRPLPPAPPLSPGLRDLLMLALVLAAMAWLVRRRSQPGVRRWRSTVLLLASGLLLTLALARCGGGGPAPNPGTPAGTYTLTVTGSTSSGSGTVSHSVTLTLYVS
ncbi:MAG TPA: MBG domain-containing protein [Terriglobia bacterium]|nr:MBG domain-containing protein [Terriglobia bacterium]